MATLDEPLFGAKLEAWRHKMFHIFHLLLWEKVCGNPPLYTCQLFLRYKREIFYEHDTIISEDSRRSTKASEEVRRLPKSPEVLARE